MLPPLRVTPAEWTTLSKLLDEALDLAPDARPVWLESLDSGYHHLKPQLESLLAGSSSPSLLDAIAGAGQQVGPYTLSRQLGEGGMGTVWLAERTDGLLKRPVALKLPRHAFAASALGDRLSLERDILASLNHPSIARLYDAGFTSAGQPYLALEYIEGLSLTHYCQSHQLSVRSRIELFLEILDAVAYAHSRLVVHRDLKPSNILVTSDGHARLLDFGIAKLLNPGDNKELTGAQRAPYTPDYAAPEQIHGEAITIATDVFSLGVLLYELLTSQLPFRGPSRAYPAQAPSAAAKAQQKQLQGDLDTVILHALEEQPERRYPTVQAFAEDLRRHLAGDTVLARRPSTGERLSRLFRRNRLASAAVLAAVLALICGAGVALWQASIANAERAHANAVKSFLVSMLEEADPYQLSQKPEPVTELLDRASRQISTQFPDRPQVQAELLTVLGTTLIDRHDLQRGEALLTEAVRLGTETNGPRHPLTLQARAFLSLAHRFSWPVAKRRAEVNSLLADFDAVPSAAPLHRFIALESDWVLLQAEGQNPKLIALARKILTLPGLPKAKQIEAQWLLIQSLRRNPGSGEDLAVAARSAFAATLAFHQQNARHPAVIEAREELGRTLASQAVSREALTELARAASDAELVFGANSPAPVFFSFNLARYQWQVGLLTEALKSLEHTEACLQRQGKDPGRVQNEILELRAKILFALRRYQDIPVAMSADIGRLAAIRLGQNLDVLLIKSLSLRYLAIAEEALSAKQPMIAAEQARLAATTAPSGPLGLGWRAEAALLLARAGTNASPCSALKPAISELNKTLLEPTPLLKELTGLSTASSCQN